MSLNTRSLLAALAFAGALCAGHSALGAGFQLNEMSARGTAMGNALVANPDDASAVFFNPAGMVEVPGTAVSAGVTLVRPSMDVSTLGADGWKTTENDVTWWTLPSLFSTFQLSEDFWAGIGIYVPFGLGSQFSPSWVGRYSNYDTVITSFNLNPSVAWRISDRLSVGAGLVVNFTEFQVKRKVPNAIAPEAGDLDFYLDGDWNVAFGGNVGLRYEILDNLQWGIAYRSELDHDLTGTTRVRVNTPAGMMDVAQADSTCDFELPALASTGFNYQPTDRWNLGASVAFTQWKAYEELDIRFKEPLFGKTSAKSVKDWYNVWRFAVGAEYKALDWLTARCGYVFDEEPTRDSRLDYLVPANDRHILSCGLGFQLTDALSLDVAYAYLLIPERGPVQGRPAEGVLTTEVEGETHMLSATLNYRF